MFICSDPRDDVYKNLIDLAFDVCNEFILVVRKEPGLFMNNQGMLILDKLKGSLKEMKKQSEWVSEKLAGNTANVYYYKTDSLAREIIKNASNSLYSWVHPNLPEDLCFIKDGKPWLINIAHEYESCIKTDCEEEIKKIMNIEGLDVQL